jgi:hypothetical protein
VFKQDVAAFDLNVLEKAPNPRVLKIAYNPVQAPDLAPLGQCPLLEKLSVGALEPIDLAPLTVVITAVLSKRWARLGVFAVGGARPALQEARSAKACICPRLTMRRSVRRAFADGQVCAAPEGKCTRKADPNELAPDGNGQKLFDEHLRERDKSITSVPDVWAAIRPGSPKDNATAHSVGAYLFQCLDCQEYVILWDCD